MSPATGARGSEVCVRVAGPDDWTTWRDLRLRALRDSPSAFGSTYEREAAFDEAFWRERLAPTEPTDVAVLAYRDGVAVGMGGGFGDLPGFVHVVAMWTAPAHRGHGVGAAVLDALAAWAGERGFRLHLDVNTTNAGARALYERSGYVATGETRPLREGSDERVERMVRRPSPSARERRDNGAMPLPIRVIRASDLVAADPTPGMVRLRAFEEPLLWAGQVETAPGAVSGWHHHDRNESSLYVVSGILRLEFAGHDGWLDAGPGDFVHVPAYTVHRESNPTDEVSVAVIARAGGGIPTVNVDAPPGR